MGVRSLYGCGAAGEFHSSSLASGLGAAWLACHLIRAVSSFCVTSFVHRFKRWQQPARFVCCHSQGKTKKVRICRSSMRTFRIQSLIVVSLSLYHGELLSAGIMAGLLARDSSSRRLPGFSTSDIMPFVLAYSGGSAGDSFQFHIKALSSLARLRLLNVPIVRLRRLNPRRLDIILNLNWSYTPLPYQALSGTVIRYSIVIQQA